MPHTAAFYDWNARVEAPLGVLPSHYRAARAEYSFGLLLARCGGLTAVVAHRVALLGWEAHARRARRRELYPPASAKRGTARTALDHTMCFGPLVRWAAGTHPDQRLVLALDPTNLTGRFRVRVAAVRYHGSAVPVAWAVPRADEKGSWNDIGFDLLGRLNGALGDGRTVLVRTDRGVESAARFRALVRLGWHPRMRANARGTFQPANWHKGYEMSQLAAHVGPGGPVPGLRTQPGNGWRAPCGRAGSRGTTSGGWCSPTGRPRAPTRRGTGGRPWIEHGFRAIKGGCWGWHQAQMREPARVARLWAVLAVATRYAIDVGGEAAPANVPPVRGPLSRWTRGLLRIWAALLNRDPMPTGTIPHHDRPATTGGTDILLEPYVHEG